MSMTSLASIKRVQSSNKSFPETKVRKDTKREGSAKVEIKRGN